jgi:hypothetical protein
MKIKRLGGWQCWVDLKKDYVIKTPKTKEEMSKTIKRYLDSINKTEELEYRVKKMQEDIKNSTRIIKSSTIPKELLASPEFLKDRKVRQKRAIVLEDKFDELLKNKNLSEAKKLVDKIIDFLIELWMYGIHEKTFKVYSNLGLINNKIVLIDLFELTDKKEKVEKQIMNKSWSHLNQLKKCFDPEIIEYFLEQAEKRLTINKLNKVWKIKNLNK